MYPRVQNRATTQAAARKRAAQIFRANARSLPAPVGGWNARDNIADMPEDDAVLMINIFPSATDVGVRDGYEVWADGFTGICESLLPWNGPTSNKQFAAVATENAFFDVTAQGAVGAAVQTGLSNARWQSTNFATAGGNFMYAVNGADNARLYDGTTWTTITGISTPAITGVDTADLIGVNVFKRRLWFVEKGTLKVWYLPVDSIGGAAQPIDLRSYAGLGGYVMSMATWTIDAGNGSDDMAVFMTSEGQVAVFRGIDPSNDVTWALAGVWNVGSPIGRRCFQKWGGDLLVIAYDGVFTMSSLLQSDRVDPHVALSDKIRTAMSDAVAVFAPNYGWDMLVFPRANMLLTNIPVNDDGGNQQYVMNTIKKSWCRFTGWDATCWMLFQNEPYFGGQNFVGRIYTGTYADDGSDIEAVCEQAFNYFGGRGQEKRFTMMRQFIQSDGVPSILANINVDFQTALPTFASLLTPAPVYVWDSGLWDVATWGGDVTYKVWQGVTGIGYCGAPILTAKVNGMTCRWLATDVVMEAGAII